MEFKPVSLEYKNLFDRYFALKEYSLSEFTFTNLFIWRNTYNIKFAEIGEFLVIFANTCSGKPFYMMPIGNRDISSILDYLADSWENPHIPIFRSLTNNMVLEIEKARPSMFNFEPELTSFEYVYLSEDLISLNGKKYHSKRNHINKFLSLYNYKYIPYATSMREKCTAFLEKWHASAILSNESVIDLENENRAIYELLNNFDSLNVAGGLIEVGGDIIAFTFGEKLTQDMFLIHIEKADKKFHGSYTIINNEFAQANCKEFTYINREEDLGIEGLRKAKMSYRPVELIKKHSAFIAKMR